MTDFSTNLDPENMLGYLDALPEDLEKAWQLGKELPLPTYPQIERVVIAGMGGSAIGGDLLAAYLADQLTIPVISHRNYALPAWAKGKNTLVICSSHSGNTEETLSSLIKPSRRIVRFWCSAPAGDCKQRQPTREFRCGPLCILVSRAQLFHILLGCYWRFSAAWGWQRLMRLKLRMQSR